MNSTSEHSMNQCFPAPSRRGRAISASVLAASLAMALAGGARAEEAADSPFTPRNGVQGYVLSSFFWGVYETKQRTECPEGLNAGPRDQIAAQYPEAVAGQQAPGGRTLEEIFIRREAGNYWPELWDHTMNPIPWRESKSRNAYGLNLDGRIDEDDFSAPNALQCTVAGGIVHKWGDVDRQICNGEDKGIDNELYKVIGCNSGFRTGGSIAHAGDEDVRTLHFNRMVMELTGVDSLENDDDVKVTFYRALDPVVMDGTAKPLPGTTQRIDARRGKRFTNHFRGKIVNGELTTEPGDYLFPWNNNEGYQVLITPWVRGMRMKVRLTPEGGVGVMAGYADIEAFFDDLARGRHTEVHRGYTNPGMWRQLHARADGYPDPKTGKNTAISSSMIVKFTQAFIQHPPAEPGVASDVKPAPAASRR